MDTLPGQPASYMLMLRIITVHQSRRDKADRLGKWVAEAIGRDMKPEISHYAELPDSYDLTFEIPLKKDQDHHLEGLRVASALCMPWTLQNFSSKGIIELIFNVSPQTVLMHQGFNVIHWAHLQVLPVEHS